MTAFREASDRALYVDVGESIGAASQARVARLLRWLEAHPPVGVVNVHPAYTSVLVVFDPLATTPDEIQRELSAPLEHLDTLPLDHPRTVEIPVRYGGIDGPDLGDVAAYHGISAQRVVELHSAAWYTVDFLGFVPGFAYLGGLPAELATPRLETPRTHVPAGSLGIAGAQTGVYPFITPGGWRIIGRTDERLFDAEREPASLLQTGDRVRFVAA